MTSCPRCAEQLRAGSPFCARCGYEIVASYGAAPTDPLLGHILAQKFRILSVLGEGGMGKVYKAEQLPLGVEVVIKVLHSALCADPNIVKRFFREAQAASRLRHPNSVSVLDFGDADGTLYIAMELLRGRTLAQVLAQDGRFEPRRAIRVVTQVLDVLEAAHRMNIVHRDLKPDNIMVEDLATQRDFVKVLDFGIAKIVTRDEREAKLTQTGMIFGTPQYMAPEQANDGVIDGRSDLYAIGVMLFELLTGQLPFRSTGLATLLSDLVSKPAPPVLSIRADLPPKLAMLIDRALAKASADRPQTALELKLGLEDVDLVVTKPGVAPGGTSTVMLTSDAAATTVTTAPCPQCGHPLPTIAKFCGECGASTVRGAAGTDKFADLRRFLPTGVIDELSQLRVRGSQERREIAVAVIDVSGAALQGSSAGEEQLLLELFTRLGEIALRHGGTLERQAGAGGMLLFGVTMSHADDAERAVRAALEARDSVKTFNANHGVELEATYAIHGGIAIVEHTERGPTCTPVGDTFELPTRLAGTVAAGKVLVSEHVHGLLGKHVQVRVVQAVRLKGRSAAVPVYEVIGARSAAGLPASLARPPLIERDPAIAAIAARLDSATSGAAIHVVGEHGAGKTRLLEELFLRLSDKRRMVITAPTAEGAVRRASPTITRLLAAMGGTLDAYRALGLASHDARILARYLEGTPSGLGETEDQLAVVSVVRAALELLATRLPVMVVIDDVQLADPITSALIRRWIYEPIPRTVLVTAARRGYPVPWASDGPPPTALAVLELPPLGNDAIGQVVDGALSPTPAPPAIRDLVISRAAGSPLMALELLHALIDGGALTSVGGRWTMTGDPAAVVTPAGLRALFAARIDALPPRARDLLACAAAFDREIATDLLHRTIATVLGAPADTRFDGELDVLIARGLLIARPPNAVVFVDDSLRDAAYERLVADTRKRIHHAIAVTLEAAPDRGVAEEAIARHYETGGDLEASLRWLARAVTAATAARERRRIVTTLTRAREVAKLAAATGDPTRHNRRLADDSLALAEALLELGELATIRTILTEGLVAAHQVDDPELIARLRRSRGRAQLAAGDADAAIVDLDNALNAALGLRDRRLLAELYGDLGEAHDKRGDLGKATEYMMNALELAQGATSGDVQRVALRILTGLGRIALRQKEHERAQRFLQQGLDLAEALDDKLGASRVIGNLAGVYHARRDYPTAIKFVERALDLAREIGDLVGTARQLNNLGTIHGILGDTATAAANYDAAFTAAQRAGWREGMASAAAARDKLRRA